LIWTIYATPLILAVLLHLLRRRRREALSRKLIEELLQAGLTEPSSRYPVIDPEKCMGGGACVIACPDKALGFVNGKAYLVNPAHCVGHGVCAPACPTGAITLVYGTKNRGMEIPHVEPTFETNVPGIYIAGELGGLGLIHNAIEQGRLAMESIAKRRGEKKQLDVVIVGAGPAGLASTLGAMDKKLRFVTLEQEDAIGGTVNHRFPRNKRVMTYPVSLPLIGRIKVREILKEALLELWKGIANRVKMPVNFNERVEQVIPAESGFTVKTNRGEYHTANVLLALGRGGTPRKLDVPGEDLPKVIYRLTDAEKYRGRQVLVVGGGDSAIEAAVALSKEPGTRVTLSYRRDAFGRVKPKNREDLAAAEDGGQLAVMLNSNVTLIEEHRVTLDHKGESISLGNDTVIVCAGGVLPTEMLRAMGIQVDTKYGTE
jgi:thioredoxin reductase